MRNLFDTLMKKSDLLKRSDLVKLLKMSMTVNSMLNKVISKQEKGVLSSIPSDISEKDENQKEEIHRFDSEIELQQTNFQQTDLSSENSSNIEKNLKSNENQKKNIVKSRG